MKAVGGHVWIAGIVALALVSCTGTDQPADPYVGAPARGRP